MRFLLFCLVSLTSQLSAQTKIKVWVQHTGDDAVGTQLAYEVREAVRRSAAYELSTYQDYLFAIRLTTIDPDDNSRGAQTVVSVTYTMYNYLPYKAGDPQTWLPIYLTAEVLVVGRNRTDTMAKGVISTLDREVENFKSQSRSPRR